MEERSKVSKGEDQDKVENKKDGDASEDAISKEPRNSHKQSQLKPRSESKGEEYEKKVKDSQDSALVIQDLEEHNFIVSIKKLKDPKKYGDCQFYCEVCHVALERLGHCKSHTNSKGHKKQKKAKGPTLKLSRLPHPIPSQITALEALLEPVITQHGLQPDLDFPIRQQIAVELENIILSQIPGSSLSLYGSSLTCFGFKSSDVNLDLNVPDEIAVPQALLTVLDLLKNNDRCQDVKDEFEKKVPQIVFIHKKTGLSCEVSCGNDTAYNTNSLLKKYADLDPVVRKLVVAFRYWAMVCAVDRQSEGSLPTYALALMVIQFLQQRRPPVLPVLSLKEKESSHSQNHQLGSTPPLGLLWFKLFRYYCVEFNNEDIIISISSPQPPWREDKKWGHKRYAIEDPYSSKRNVGSSLSSDKVFEYVMDCLQTSFLYFGTVPRETRQSAIHHDVMRHPSVATNNGVNAKQAVRSGVSESSDGLEVYEEHASDDEGSGSSIEDSREEKKRRPHSRHLTKEQSLERRQKSPQNGDEEIFRIEDLEDGNEGGLTTSSEVGNSVPRRLENPIVKEDSKLATSRGTRKGVGAQVKELHGGDVKVEDVSLSAIMEKLCINDGTNTVVQNHEYVEPKILYKFDRRILSGGRSAEVMCCYCKRDGHVMGKCPDLKKHVMTPLPQMSARFMEIVDMTCLRARATLAFAPQEIKYRELVLRNLETYIREIYPDSRLHLFGSSINGFGFKDSDLDICMTLDGKKKHEVECIPIITQLSKKLKKHRDCSNVLAITTAKVPIVKFYLRSVHREGDISLYNILALENTNMLLTYTRIDDRVSVLGYTLKLFAKVCDIGDASKGSLSSYAYILMLLHFLQKRQPPVVPVLQELYTGARSPQNVVEGWNCWFFSDLRNLMNIWKPQVLNKESVGSLWLGFLCYFTEVFDWEHDVVCCRRTSRLTKFEKMWTKHVFAIEDPFNLDHNLGAGINRKMANFIQNALRRARERFGYPAHGMPMQFVMEYFFDADVLTDGALAPVDRNCRICGRIGHLAKDCPMSKTNRREEKMREEEERKAEARGERSRLSNRPFAVVDLTPPRNRAASSPAQPIISEAQLKVDKSQFSGSLPSDASLLGPNNPTSLPSEVPLSQAMGSPSIPRHDKPENNGSEDFPPITPQKVNQGQAVKPQGKTSQAVAQEVTVSSSVQVTPQIGLKSSSEDSPSSAGGNAVGVSRSASDVAATSSASQVHPQGIPIQEPPSRFAHMVATSRLEPAPVYPTLQQAHTPPSQLMRPEEFLSPPRPIRSPVTASGPRVLPQPHYVNQIPQYALQQLAPGAGRSIAHPLNMPPRYSETSDQVPRQAIDPRGGPWPQIAPIEAWYAIQSGKLNPRFISPLHKLPGRQRSLSESMTAGQTSAGQQPIIVGSAPSNLPYGSPPNVVRGQLQAFNPGVRSVGLPSAGSPVRQVGHSTRGSPSSRLPLSPPFQMPTPPPGMNMEQPPLLWQQQQGSPQPRPTMPASYGNHMTGNQFLDMIRMVESKQSEEENTRQRPQKDDEEPRHKLVYEDVLRKSVPNPIMKSPKTEDERELFSKLDKVRSLWSGDMDNNSTSLQYQEGKESESSLSVILLKGPLGDQNCEENSVQERAKPDTLHNNFLPRQDAKKDSKNKLLNSEEHHMRLPIHQSEKDSGLSGSSDPTAKQKIESRTSVHEDRELRGETTSNRAFVSSSQRHGNTKNNLSATGKIGLLGDSPNKHNHYQQDIDTGEMEKKLSKKQKTFPKGEGAMGGDELFDLRDFEKAFPAGVGLGICPDEDHLMVNPQKQMQEPEKGQNQENGRQGWQNKSENDKTSPQKQQQPKGRKGRVRNRNDAATSVDALPEHPTGTKHEGACSNVRSKGLANVDAKSKEAGRAVKGKPGKDDKEAKTGTSESRKESKKGNKVKDQSSEKGKRKPAQERKRKGKDAEQGSSDRANPPETERTLQVREQVRNERKSPPEKVERDKGQCREQDTSDRKTSGSSGGETSGDYKVGQSASVRGKGRGRGRGQRSQSRSNASGDSKGDKKGEVGRKRSRSAPQRSGADDSKGKEKPL